MKSPFYPDELQRLEQAVEVLAPKFEQGQAAAALAPFLDAIQGATTNSGQLSAIAQALQRLAPKLKRSETQADSGPLQAALAWAPNDASAAAIASAYDAFLPREPGQGFVATIVAAIGFPMAAGPATDVLIESLRNVGGPGKEVGLDATLAWLREAYPDIDPVAVPACPAPLAGWEGQQCPER